MSPHRPVVRRLPSVLSPLAAAGLSALLLAACGGAGDDTEPRAAALSSTASSATTTVHASSDARAGSGGSARFVTGYLSHSPRVLRVEGGPQARGELNLRASQTGYHEVLLWWPQALQDAGRVRARLGTGPDRIEQEIDQRHGGGRWVSLGFHAFTAGQQQVLELSSRDGAPIYVDAAQLRFSGIEVPALRWRELALPLGLVGEPYDAQLEPLGGKAPYRFALKSGQLPPGFTLDAATGTLQGLPRAAGSFAAVFMVTDADGQSIELPWTFVIDRTAAARLDAPGQAPSPRNERQRRALQAPGASSTPDLGHLLGLIGAMPEGAWARVNVNSFADVWTPEDLRPLYNRGNPTPSRIILAWSSFAWDSRRGKLWLYGGGHANYRGNDVYAWDGSTRRWERASLPSEMTQDIRGHWVAMDGPQNAPASAHTYDNTMYFPLLDRVVVLGGAADANGGHYFRALDAATSIKTGPYLFDPSRADGDKVGGTTGSHVRRVAPYPEIVGGSMWSNRDAWVHNAATAPPEAFVEGCTGVGEQDGVDVAFIRTVHRIYSYRVQDVLDPSRDTWRQVGRYWGGSGGQATCAYDQQRDALVVAERNTRPFVYFDLSRAGSTNDEVVFTPVDLDGGFLSLLASNALDLRFCGMDRDPRRDAFMLWCGDDRVWKLTPPSVLGATGWTIQRAPAASSTVPTEGPGTGILGKWKYIPNLDVFMGLADPVMGNIWIYKPVGWVNPAGDNLPPTVSLTSPDDGATFTLGQSVTLAAGAADADGQISRVEFLVDGVVVAQVDQPPFSAVWNPVAAGDYLITARALDDRGGTSTSAPRNARIQPGAPPNEPPSVSLVTPVDGAVFEFGTPVPLRAEAADGDGRIVKVEFFAGVAKIGEATSPPFAVEWTGAAPGSHVLVARATDDDGASSSSAPATILVTATGDESLTVTLQRSAQGPASAVADTYLSTYHKARSWGAEPRLQDQRLNYSMLVRFAIFQSEGGPIPNGATIDSAKLTLYKSSAYPMTYTAHRLLVPWSEADASWNLRLPGVAWQVAGANGAGTDFVATPDASGSVDWDPGWVEFDVTSAVSAMSAAVPTANHGWRLRQLSGNTLNLKQFHSSEYTANPDLRPKLTVTYR